MRLVTNQEMGDIDRWAQRTIGITGAVLMENAGRGCVDVLKKYFELRGLKALIVCGKGNNGGDGFVVARHLANAGSVVKVALLCRTAELKGDARTNFRIATRAGIEVHEVEQELAFKRILRTFHADCIVDAIFGTGFKGKPRGIYHAAIELINRSDSFLFSVDIPSGINGDTGRFEIACVVADATATLCLPKRGNHLFPGHQLCGDLHVVDIGMPLNLIDKGYPRLAEFEEVRGLLPYRPPQGNKGTFGQVLVIAGARGFSGAAAMAAISALKTGAGLVRLAAPRTIMDAIESKHLEVVKIPLEQTAQETISPAALRTLIPFLEKSDTVVIGPGITTHPETARFVRDLLPRVRVPLIIDADAINIIAQHPGILKKLRAPFILTPHPGELSRMIKRHPYEINNERIDLSLKCARSFGGVMVLKGAPTVTAAPAGEIYVNPTGNSGLATAGSGDVLVGMISGFLAQRVSALGSSVAGVFLHGLCADLAMEKSNEYSLTASDLFRYIPTSINYIIKRDYEKIKRD